MLCNAAYAQERSVLLNIKVNAPEGEDITGQPIQVTQTDYQLSYGSLKLDSQGSCSLNIYPGNNNVTLQRDGYERLSQDFYVADGTAEHSVTLNLVEKTRTPYALNAEVAHNAYDGTNSITLSWNTELPAFFDDFESYEGWAVNFAPWTGIDVDQEAAAALLGSYPNRAVLQYAQIINPMTVEPTWWVDYPILRPYSGQQYVGFTRTSSGNANDDWLISPTVTVGTDNVLSFMAKAADQFPERFMVYITTNTQNPTTDAFTRLDRDNFETADHRGWREFVYDLADYAGKQVKFAIRYISEYNRFGSFMLMVDDVYVGQPRTAAARTAAASFSIASSAATSSAVASSADGHYSRRVSGGSLSPASSADGHYSRRVSGGPLSAASSADGHYSRRVSAGPLSASSAGLKSPANPNETFSVYLDNVLAGTTDGYTFTLEGVAPGRHTLGVKAVYQQAESPTATVQVDVPTADSYTAVTFDVTAKSVLSTDGLLLSLVSSATTEEYTLAVHQGKATIASLPRGQYIVSTAEGAFEQLQQTISVEGAEATFSLVLDDHVIAPYNVTADTDADGNTIMRWNRRPVFSDSFESYDDFATGTFGEWTSIDLDQQPVYPIALGAATNIIAFPGSGTANNPRAIAPMVFNPWNTTPPMLPTDGAIAAPTGEKSVIFFSPQRNKADKWLISPLLDIYDGYQLSLKAKGYTSLYPEAMDFCVSPSGSSRPDDFTVLSSANPLSSEQWSLYTADLSSYAGQTIRLAVHYKSNDAFLAQVDDFTVGPESGEGEVIDYGNVVRYDIYVDGEKVGETTTPSFVLPPLSDGLHVVGIKAVYFSLQSETTEYEIDITTAIDGLVIDPSAPGASAFTVPGASATIPGASATIPGASAPGAYNLQGQPSAPHKGIILTRQGGKYVKTIK